jgi:DMSO/TMAO reductase YedYZ molybdopterin-dependent catalytic subunit
MKKPVKNPRKELTVDQKINRRNFISFGTFAVLGGVAFGGWRWLYRSPIEKLSVTGGTRKPLRRALNKTELFVRRFYSNNNLVKTYPKSMAAKNARHNTSIGADSKMDMAAWKLQVNKLSGEKLFITLDEIKALPKTEMVFDFKCVEGWDEIQYWGGVKFIDFIQHFGLQSETRLQYVGMATPDNKYYVGLDMPSAMHPQTLLAYELNTRPLPPKHGQPLRLIIPVKYGIKNLKRIGTISFSNHRPPDYWAELGYDYYSGL